MNTVQWPSFIPVEEDLSMASNLLFHQLLLVALVLLCLLLHVGWPDNPRVMAQMPRKPDKPRRMHSTAPAPFPGLIHKPLCETCQQEADACRKAPSAPPPMIAFAQGRRHTVDTQEHACPAPECAYHGWRGCGNIRAKGYPGGQPRWQLQCVACHGYFSETQGTIFHERR